jgi:L-ascorbate metabolism protein UlaG (beta-lactamase superfamily)
MELTYLGTATIALRFDKTTFLTDPAFDPAGTKYDFGLPITPRSWFESEKQYETPVRPESLGAIDAVLLSHDHHADNFDYAGRKLAADPNRVARVVTTTAGAKRLVKPMAGKDEPGGGLGLGSRVTGLAPGEKTRVGDIEIAAIVARHGPFYAPQVNQVIGFVLDVPSGPRVWISGDTVLIPELRRALTEIGKERPVDVAVVHCGAVGFPRAIGFGGARFTFDASEAIEACKLAGAKTIVPVHRAGWAHFRQSEDDLRAAIDRAGLTAQTRMLELGQKIEL